MMISTVRGRFNEYSGTVNLGEQNPEQSKVDWTIATASINTNEAKREAHLQSPDFFDVEKYPTITFRGTRVTRLGGDRYQATSNLTIRDVTKERTFDVRDEGKGQDPWRNNRRLFRDGIPFGSRSFEDLDTHPERALCHSASPFAISDRIVPTGAGGADPGRRCPRSIELPADSPWAIGMLFAR
jgi:hypothetical protein